MRPSIAPSTLALALTLALAIASSSPTAAAPPSGDSPRDDVFIGKLASSNGDEVKIQIVTGFHPHQGELDQVHIICRGDDDNLDLALPKSWVSFMVHHVDGGLEVEGKSIDLGLLWQTIEDLGPGEEILIQDHEDLIRIWLE